MSFVQVYVAKGEIEASVIKGLFESVGIKSKISLIENNLPSRYGGTNTINGPHGVYVEEEKVEEAKKVLSERK
jgi:hypothetical protein